jgi:hypothetical protein
MQTYINWLFALLLGALLISGAVWLSRPKGEMTTAKPAQTLTLVDPGERDSATSAAMGMLLLFFGLAILLGASRPFRQYVLRHPRDFIFLLIAALLLAGKLGSLL